MADAAKEVHLVPSDMELVFDRDGGGHLLMVVLTASGKKKLTTAGLIPGNRIGMKVQVNPV